jgi:hypothetical protein
VRRAMLGFRPVADVPRGRAWWRVMPEAQANGQGGCLARANRKRLALLVRPR